MKNRIAEALYRKVFREEREEDFDSAIPESLLEPPNIDALIEQVYNSPEWQYRRRVEQLECVAALRDRELAALERLAGVGLGSLPKDRLQRIARLYLTGQITLEETRLLGA